MRSARWWIAIGLTALVGVAGWIGLRLLFAPLPPPPPLPRPAQASYGEQVLEFRLDGSPEDALRIYAEHLKAAGWTQWERDAPHEFRYMGAWPCQRATITAARADPADPERGSTLRIEVRDGWDSACD